MEHLGCLHTVSNTGKKHKKKEIPQSGRPWGNTTVAFECTKLGIRLGEKGKMWKASRGLTNDSMRS